MTVWSGLREVLRWLFRRPEPPPPPGTGQRHQAREQAEARRQLLDQAQRLRDSRWCCGPTQMMPNGPMTLGQRTGYGARAEW